MATISWSMSQCGGAGRRDGRSGLPATTARSNSGCCMSSNSPRTATSSARMSGSISRRSFSSCRRADMADVGQRARTNQKRRTRKDLLQAASRLMKQGRKPSIDEIAEEALVSRATAYRYFPGLEALLVEASLDVAVPSPQELFERASDDPIERMQRVDTALHDVISGNEAPFRMMLIHALERGLERKDGDELPIRQNRRAALIEAALAPVRDELTPQAF